MKLSSTLKQSIRLHPKRHYRIAQEAEMHPSTLSKLLNDMIPIHEDDERVLRLARSVGISPSEAFEQQ